MSVAMELHVALSLRLDATEAYRLAHAYRDEVLAENGNAAAERDCLAMAVQFALSWKDSATRQLREGIEEILATMPSTEEKATATAATATPTAPVFDPLPSYLHAIGHAGSETERGLYAGYVQAIAEVVRLQAATATASGPTGRVAQLLDAIRTHRGEWTTKRVQDLYRGTPLAPPNAPNGRLRHVARGDLRDLHAWGHLVLHEETGRRFYTLKTRKDARS